MGATSDSVESPTEEPRAPASTAQPVYAPVIADSTGATYTVGEAITITDAGEPWALLNVVEVQQDGRLADSGSISGGKPQTEGNVFLSVRVRFRALAGQVSYSPLAFQPFVAGEPVDGLVQAADGRRPGLSFGTLSRGHTAEGWLVYEVPATGPVFLGYGGNVYLDEPPLFEVILRDS